ncbi:MAG TPA: hypothetical protein VFT66_24230 [Roseiflexaceae bacterium]|nr:hypothetical protein [Roseiflexaceae bacterium]
MLTLIGSTRDLRRGVLALAGTLLGASLVYTWSPWINQHTAAWFEGGNPQRWSLVLHLLAFGGTVLVVGYGGSLLFNKAIQMKVRERTTTTLLGLLNGLLIVAYALTFAGQANENVLPVIEESTATRLLHNGLPYLLLAIPLFVFAVILVRGIMALNNAPPAKPAPQGQQGGGGGGGGGGAKPAAQGAAPQGQQPQNQAH